MIKKSNHLSNSEKIQQAYNSDPLSNRERIVAENKRSSLSNAERVKNAVLYPSSNEPFFLQKAPILCNEYRGISSHSRNFLSSDRITHSTEIVRSSSDIVRSSNQFRSSDAILEYLKYHPDYYQKVTPSQLSPAVAIILSSLTIGVGVVMFVVSHIAGSPVLSLATSLVLGSGLTGFTEGISGIRHKHFDWGHFAKHVAADSIITLLTFGSSYTAGGVIGLALKGKCLNKEVIETIGKVAGHLVGSGVKTGTHVIKTTIEGKIITAKSLIITILEGVVEGVEGAEGGLSAAGYLTAHIEHDVSSLSLMVGTAIASSKLGIEVVEVYEHPNHS